MTGEVTELQQLFGSRARLAESISTLYEQQESDRNGWRAEKVELRNYIFATDTTKTTNRNLPWKNTTTIPKLCQIRDNLHANYMASMFPNDEWMKWEAYSEDAADSGKKQAIQAYLSNKIRESDFKNTISKLVYDYIDYGNAFAEAEYIVDTFEDDNGETVTTYVGPVAKRISPLDITFNVASSSFRNAPKIIRKIVTIGELERDIKQKPDNEYSEFIIENIKDFRATIGRYDKSDMDKATGIQIDGFGSLQEYYGSNYIELLEFRGDMYDEETGELIIGHSIIVADRQHIVRKAPIKSWLGKNSICHSAWRKRPDNLYGMGPLDNLVGMQYRIDHLENIKADLFDLIAHPPITIKGNVEEFEWSPMAEIYMGDDGEVNILKVDATALQADTQIAILEQKMEEYAGAPKQAMGFRTPGEKTAYEVQSLENAASRIFQEKIQQFETEVVEPLLNMMLELGRRNLTGTDLIRVMDDDLGIQEFIKITKDDITAKGKIRPRGARHFAATSQLVQNVTNLFNSPVGQMIMPHTSAKQLSKLVEDVLGLERFDLFQDNIAILEQADTQRVMNQAQEDVEVEDQTPIEDDIPEGEE